MSPHPQALFLALIGLHLLEQPRALSGTSVVYVMNRLGISAPAARSVLQRNTVKGFVLREKAGRKTFYRLSERATAVLLDGRQKMYAERSEEPWDGNWTVVRVQIPEAQRSLRHKLSARLSWSGFGRVDAGTWVTPRAFDVAQLLDGVAAGPAPLVLYGQAQAPTTDQDLVSAFDVAGLAAGYLDFGAKWHDRMGAPLNPDEALIARVEMHYDWLGLTRNDPQLPVTLLPRDWPGAKQARLFQRLDADLAAREAPLIDAFFAGELARGSA